MEKTCFLHDNGCFQKWELFVGDRKPDHCGQGGFVRHDNGSLMQWDDPRDAINYARRILDATDIRIAD